MLIIIIIVSSSLVLCYVYYYSIVLLPSIIYSFLSDIPQTSLTQWQNSVDRTGCE